MRGSIVALGFSLPLGISAQLYQSAQDGIWYDPNTWACNCVPSVADSVEIAHHVTIQNSITLTNAWVHITPSGWMGFASTGFLAITQPVLNEGTLYLIGDLDIDWLLESPGIIEVNGNFFNDDDVDIGGGGLIRVNGNFMNDGTITGGGAICVSGITVNNGDLIGTLDFCDETPAVSVPPFIDTNTGTVDQGIVYCASEKCSVGLGEGAFAGLVLAPNPAHDEVTFEGMPVGAELRIYDGLGQLVLAPGAAMGTRTTLDLTGLAKGIYLVAATKGMLRLTTRLVVE
ncbi:MAG: T9SS type A sorting domain-containing protein [Flavobacteriales bacterium]|nr:T9SS type A sorting domain-containing protein [Flavobacteriales bacterium]